MQKRCKPAEEYKARYRPPNLSWEKSVAWIVGIKRRSHFLTSTTFASFAKAFRSLKRHYAVRYAEGIRSREFNPRTDSLAIEVEVYEAKE